MYVLVTISWKLRLTENFLLTVT